MSTPPPARRRRRATTSTSSASSAASTGSSSRRSRRSSRTGSGPSRGSRATTSRGTRATTSSVRRSRPGVGFAGFLLALAIDPDRYRRAQKGIYAVTILLMLLVFPLAATTRGSKRWIEVGPFQFQPSEFGKLLFVLALAGFLADRARRLGDVRVVAQTIGLAAVPITLVFLQPDLGTSLVYVAALTACAVHRRRALAAPRRARLARRARVREHRLVPARRRRRGAEAVPGRAADGVREPRPRPRGRQLQPEPVDHGGRLGRPRRARRRRRDADAARLPARACDRLRLRLARRAARLLRRRAPAGPLPARRLARACA